METEQNSLPKILIAVWIVLLLIIIAGATFYIVNHKNAEKSENGAKDTSIESLKDLCSSDNRDMAALWPEYSPPNGDFSLQYPNMLSPSHSSGEEVTVTSFSATSSVDDLAIMVWVWETDNLDDRLSEVLMPTCSDGVDYEDVRYGEHILRQAISVNPRRGCINMPNLPENQDFTAYGTEISDGKYFILRNDGLTTDQLEAVLCSLEI